jgi:signal transduction histidine kinase
MSIAVHALPGEPRESERDEPDAGSLLASTAVRILIVASLACLPLIALAIVASSSVRPVWDNVHWTVSAFGAAIATAWSVRGTTGRVRAVRRWGAIAFSLWFASTVTWAWMTLTGTPSFPSINDLLILSIAVPGVGFLVSTVHGRLSAADEAAAYFDAALGWILIGSLIVFVFGPTVAGVPTAPGIAALAYPTGFIGLGVSGLVGVLAVGQPIAARGGSAIAVGAVLIGLAYLGWIGPAMTLSDPGEASSILFTLGTLVAAFGSATWSDEHSTSVRYLALAREATRIFGPTVTGVLLLLLILPTPDSIDRILRVLVFAGGILLLIRQGRVLRERTSMLAKVTELTRSNRRLVGELRRELEERTRNESRSIQAARADAVGSLSASVGHEVNNPLTGVLGYAELVLAELPEDHPSRPDVETIRVQALRAREIVSALRDFASPKAPNIQPTDLAELLARTVAAVRAGEGRGIAIAESYEAMEPVAVDAGAVERAVANVLMNACQASAPGGHILVAARIEDDDVVVTVTDHGLGMDEKTVRRAFEPFYSGWAESSDASRPTGLGLSLANGLIGSHGGKICLSSSPGRGTTVEISLPAHAARGVDGTPEGGLSQ